MSKALEAIERIENEYSIDEAVFYKEDFRQVRRELKALEIIKDKRIDIEIFYTFFIEGNRNYSFYDIHYGTYGEYCLTETEFDLLKEVLGE